MERLSIQLQFLRHPVALAVTMILAVQIAVYYALPKTETTPASAPLSQFPATAGAWTMLKEGVIEKEVQEVLKADDTLTRTYAGPDSQTASLFIAFFRTQRAGVAPHSPKVCLPGAGWVPVDESIVPVQVPGRAEPIPVNRAIIARGEHKSVVMYWYQSRDRVVADEYHAKFYAMYDSIRHRRSDTSMVRIVVPVTQGGEASAIRTAEEFLRSVFGPIRRQLPA